MRTPAQARADRKALRRDIARQQKREARQKIADLRQQLRDAKANRRQAIADAKSRCRSERLAVRDRVKMLRARALDELRTALRLERESAKSACSASIGAARGLSDKVQRSRATLAAERAFQRDMRRIEAANRKRRNEHPHVGARVRRGESDDEVRGNIPPDMVSLWERVKRGIRGTERMTRTEAFLKYAEEHPDEVLAAIDDKTDRVIRELEAREREARKELRRSRAPREVYSDVTPF